MTIILAGLEFVLVLVFTYLVTALVVRLSKEKNPDRSGLAFILCVINVAGSALAVAFAVEAGLSFVLATAAAIMGYVFGIAAVIVWTQWVPQLFKGL